MRKKPLAYTSMPNFVLHPLSTFEPGNDSYDTTINGRKCKAEATDIRKQHLKAHHQTNQDARRGPNRKNLPDLQTLSIKMHTRKQKHTTAQTRAYTRTLLYTNNHVTKESLGQQGRGSVKTKATDDGGRSHKVKR